jgi:hypothetical protein
MKKGYGATGLKEKGKKSAETERGEDTE